MNLKNRSSRFFAIQHFHTFSLLIFLQFLSSFVLAEEFTATVNRFTMEEGESLELLLKVDASSLLSEPDYKPLKKDFDIVNVGRSSQVQIINGRSKSSTIWKLALIPKITGEIIIPPIHLNKLRSQPITINVSKADANSNSNIFQTQQKIMVEAVTNKTNVYVQEQVLYTVRLLFQGIQIRKWNLSEPKVGDAVIHSLGEPSQYEKNIGGLTYGVLEKRYAIFPQSSGELKINPIIFSGVINDASSRQYITRGQQIIKRSQAVNLSIQPKNSAFQNPDWLPATALQLEEQWTPELSTLKVGESVTWTLVLKALGQNSATLPPLNIKLPPEFKTYPDQADLKEGQNADGLIGQRTQSIAIIATTPGTFKLPAVEVTWWDTKKDQLQRTRIPERDITVIAATQNMQTPPLPPSSSLPLVTIPAPRLDISNDAELLKELRLWKIGTMISIGLFLLLLIINLMLWLKRSSSKSITADDLELSEKLLQHKIQSHLKTLLSACRKNEIKHAQAALLDWASCVFSQPIQSIGQIRHKMPTTELDAELGILEGLLYSAQSDTASWDGTRLAGLLKAYKPTEEHDDRKKDALAPLYPTS